MFGKVRNALTFRSDAPLSSAKLVGVPQPISLRRLWWAVIVLLGLSASALAWTIYQLRDDAIRAAVTESGSIATVLASQLSRSLQAIDADLLEIKHTAEENGSGASAGFPPEFDSAEFLHYLDRHLRTQQIFSIAVADKSGRIIVSTLSGIE